MTEQSQSSSPSKISKQKRKLSTLGGSDYKSDDAFTQLLAPGPLKDLSLIGDRMVQHGLKFGDFEAYERYPALQEKVHEILGVEAVVDAHLMSEKRFKNVILESAELNEATFLQNVWPIIWKDGHFAKSPEGDVVFKDWRLNEHVQVTMDVEFRGTLLPHRYANKGFEREMETKLKKSDNMKNSRPDYTGLYHPFLIIEGKSAQGSELDAALHARRGAATLVHADRLAADILNITPGSVSGTASIAARSGTSTDWTIVEGTKDLNFNSTYESQQHSQDGIISSTADLTSLVFSATIIPACVTFFVHWYEEVTYADQSKEDFYHMTPVRSQSNRDPDKPLSKVRKTLHNIAKWGCGDRIDDHLRIWKTLPDYIDRHNEDQQCNTSNAKKQKKGVNEKKATSGNEQAMMELASVELGDDT
ncbi:uncharacterized protein KY384_000008 [Bacidia gigantensis]|uniref:uncharacterized protein n=1 Tax=Bacidia gigantensis TaxID=2732470 RepID=UPI001D03792A|nr:uncharacterized protein KY384_000008 [Bacidia gigantensis]KAG8526415.1 hypothetical protein KY384_000008 [Bacidia gigantensis]